MTPSQLASAIGYLSHEGPVTAEFEALAYAGKMRGDVWYKHQKEHWLGWLGDYNGPGAYGRKVHSGRDAAFVYNHLMCPPALMWLAESAGLPEAQVRAAGEAWIAAGKTLPKQCGAIRQIAPWKDVEAALV